MRPSSPHLTQRQENQIHMKNIATVIAALFFGSALFAEASKSSYTISTDFTLASEYIFRGIEQQDRAFQPSITVAYEALTLCIWTSQALNHKNESWAQGNEIDFTVAYAIALPNDATLTLGGTYYYYPSARPSFGEPDVTYEPSLAISGTIGPVNASASYYHDFVLKSDTFEFALTYSVPMKAEGRLSLDLIAQYGFNKIEDGNGDLPGTGGIDYRYHCLHANFGYKATASTTVKFGAHYVDVSRLAGAPGANLWYSGSLTISL